MKFFLLVGSEPWGDMAEVNAADWLRCAAQVLLILTLIKCHIRQMEWIRFQPLSFRVIRVANQLAYSWENSLKKV
jgi:hypothetical protein